MPRRRKTGLTPSDKIDAVGGRTDARMYPPMTVGGDEDEDEDEVI